jgi:Na+/H+ antiporter NhaD/arsenite permease-like protein
MANLLGQQLGFWTLLPFAGILIAIAVLPAVAGKWFSRNRNKAAVAAAFGLPTIVYLLARFGDLGLRHAGHTAQEYVAFLVLLSALYVISGGIYLTGHLRGTLRTNVAFLVVGAVLANFIGTTGAAMVLIRPLLRANSERKHAKHVVIFFIFLVCNVAGLLLPVGPPLFLGFLRGVPFFWTARLWPQWLTSVGLIMAVFVGVELYQCKKEPPSVWREEEADYVPMRVAGRINVLLLGVAAAVIMASGPLGRAGDAIHFPFLREMLLLALMGLSLKLGPPGPRASNDFHWRPLVEVGVLFAGIFATLVPALALLEAKGGQLALTQPWHYFWTTGGLSAFLDNAPAYLAFVAAAQGHVGAATAGGLTSSVATGGAATPAMLLAAISCGAVMVGALTYIGNAPNLMVKSIAEHSGLKMPSFAGYLGYAAAVLLPVFLVVTLVFFR